MEAGTSTKLPNPISIDDDTVPDDPVAESNPELFLEEISDILGYLIQLLPALRDPLEEDSDMTTTLDKGI